MRTHPAIAIVTVILVGFGLKLVFSSAPIVAADVGSTKRVSIDVSEMHQNIKNLPSGHSQAILATRSPLSGIHCVGVRRLHITHIRR